VLSSVIALTGWSCGIEMDLIEARDWAYLNDPPPDIDPIRRLLERYSSLPSNQIDHHLRVVVSPLVSPFYSFVDTPVSVMLLGASLGTHTLAGGSSSDYWNLKTPATSKLYFACGWPIQEMLYSMSAAA
jgi:hypothetical protein